MNSVCVVGYELNMSNSEENILLRFFFNLNIGMCCEKNQCKLNNE